ncbi:hypothetical protein CHLRE_08g361600v5 [Chlamydomonas reinhardtii]|uniref:O-fucosyltransferase family protein n=1 Tax=Chlamydomonas reinhardtii TaxID=3055 RepID=A0A2K3DGI5_CHLRE|nr:uncharacterized protein CHLRE_08g361600v5 [Chlamydomonas reinhardtii]PNW79651.1 hypothetical protein CHLRE_08g361600v5 [Chlamydomonas reinhardtii]
MFRLFALCALLVALHSCCALKTGPEDTRSKLSAEFEPDSVAVDTLKNTTFIVPVLWHGPNNQATSIKEAIALASLLPGATVVLPDLAEHKFSDSAAHRMLLDELFDLDAISKAGVSFVQLHQLRKQWDGQLDVLLYFREEKFPAVRRLVSRHMGLQPPEQEHWLRSPISMQKGCSSTQVAELRSMLRPYRFVAMLSYDDFALQTHKLAGTLLSDCGADMCCEAYKQKGPLLRKSDRIQELAQDFISTSIGKGKPYIAGHIRPMPDACVDLWKTAQDILDPKEMYDICRTDFMYNRFVPNLQALQKVYNTSTVFIMTHPLIRPRVFRMLKAGGIDPVFMDMEHFAAALRRPGAAPLATPLSFSLLAMAEEAVSAAAVAFLGTAESSMTGMIVQERLAHGGAPQHTYYMAEEPACADLPCPLPRYYQAPYEQRRQQVAAHVRNQSLAAAAAAAAASAAMPAGASPAGALGAVEKASGPPAATAASGSLHDRGDELDLRSQFTPDDEAARRRARAAARARQRKLVSGSALRAAGAGRAAARAPSRQRRRR